MNFHIENANDSTQHAAGFFGNPTQHGYPALTQTPIPTSVSTSTPLVVKYYASDIYGDFVAYGLGGTNPKTDTNWGCCTYVPQGGAIAWTDQTTGYTIDIATFTTSTVAHIDEGQLNKEGFSTNVVYNCLLSYESAFPQSLINRYLQVMATYCN